MADVARTREGHFAGSADPKHSSLLGLSIPIAP